MAFDHNQQGATSEGSSTADETASVAVRAQRVALDALPERERTAMWHDLIGQHLFQLDIDFQTEQPRASVDALETLGTHHASLVSTAQTCTRQWRHIALAPSERATLVINHTGRSRFSVKGHSTELPAGSVFLGADNLPSCFEWCEDFSEQVLSFDLARLREIMPGVDDVLYRRLSPRNPMLPSFRCALADTLEALRHFPASPSSHQAIHLARLNTAMVQSLLVCLSTELSGGEGSAPFKRLVETTQGLAEFHWQRMEQFIRAHVNKHHLQTEDVAKAVGLSVSQANRIYRQFGLSVADSIWGKRLNGLGADLRHPRHNGLTLGELSYKWGFADVAHASRAFKRWHGVSPQAFRRQSVAWHHATDRLN